MAGNVDALILGLDGQRSRDALLQLKTIWADQEQRPRWISAYPGILFRFGLEGMMDRSGADLLCLNSADDLALYGRGRKALGLDSSNAVVTGLPILWRTKQRTEAPEAPSIVFFEQPSIPVHPLQRRVLCDQIKELAAAWPDHPVIFKPHIEHRHPRRTGDGQRDRQDDARPVESAPEFQTRHPVAAPVRLRHHRLLNGGDGIDGDGNQHPHRG